MLPMTAIGLTFSLYLKILKQYPTTIATTENRVSMPEFRDKVSDFTNNICAIPIGIEVKRTVPV